MSRHESTVNFQNLIQDLADMYPFDVSEVVLIELVANALDAEASAVAIEWDGSTRALVVSDDGRGMTAGQFAEYHDFAAGLKRKGTGIGFAGVGAKISFAIAERVLTETRGKAYSGGSDWRLLSEKQLAWEDVRPSRLSQHGTRVEVHFKESSRMAYESCEDIERMLQRHYAPLFDPTFLELYEKLGFYGTGLRVSINGSQVPIQPIEKRLELEKIRTTVLTVGSKRVGYGLFGVAQQEYPLGADACGVLLCTHGKVVKAELFNQFPGELGTRLVGIVEIPGFVNYLTTSKTDFLRPRGRSRDFERLMESAREAFKRWLSEIGVRVQEVTDVGEALKLELELKRIIEDVPELSEFFGFRNRREALTADADGAVAASQLDVGVPTLPLAEGAGTGKNGPTVPEDGEEQALEADPSGVVVARPISRVARRGPKISFMDISSRIDLAWVEGNTIIINSGHPSFRKTSAGSAARRLHCLFSIAGAVQRFLDETLGNHEESRLFVDRMLAAWARR